MDSLEIIIKELCFNCKRRDNFCNKENKPTYPDAYRCNYDKAEALIKRIDAEFEEVSDDKTR